MTSDPSSRSTDTQPSNLEKLQFYRTETRHEYELLGQRVNWYVTSQSFLMTAYAISFSREPFPTNWFSCLVLPILAIFVSVLSLAAIHGASQTADMWIVRRDKLMDSLESSGNDELKDFSIPRWVSEKHDDKIRSRSLLFPKLVPCAFIVAWLTAIIFGTVSPWVKHAPDLTRPHAGSQLRAH